MTTYLPSTGVYEDTTSEGLNPALHIHHAPVVTGTGLQWSDGSDATYAENQSWTDAGSARHSTISSVSFAPITTTAAFYRFQLRVKKGPDTVSDLNGLGLEIRSGGTFVNSFPLDPDERNTLNGITAPGWFDWPAITAGAPSEATGWESVPDSLGDALAHGITVSIWDGTDADDSAITSLYIYEMRLILSDAPGCSRVILPGEVAASPYLPADAKWQPTIVGSPPQWGDDDDATYALLEQEGTDASVVKWSHAEAYLPATPYLDKIDPATAVITFGVRYSGSTTGDGLQLGMEIIEHGGDHDSGTYFDTTWTATSDGGIYEMTNQPDPATLTYYGISVADMVGRLAAGDLSVVLHVPYTSTSQARSLYVYKFWVEVAFQCLPTFAPPLRQFPRSPLRHWPPERSYQRSNRRAGGYL